MNTASFKTDSISQECESDSRGLFVRAVGSEIRRQRKKHGMTGKELALRLQVSQQQVSRYECGVCQLSVDTLIHILTILHVSIDDFFKNVFVSVFDQGGGAVENNHYRVFLSMINGEREKENLRFFFD